MKLIRRDYWERVDGWMDHQNDFDRTDIDKNKGIAMLAYLLFFIPLLAAKDSKFAMYHANQGLILLICAIAVNFIGSILPFIGWFLILPIGNICVFILFIIGIINAAGGKKKPLPLVGGFTIFK